MTQRHRPLYNRTWGAGLALTAALALMSVLSAGARVARAEREVPPPATPPATAPTSTPVDEAPITFLTHGVPEPIALDGLVQVQGEVYEDADGNGQRDAQELALAGVSVSAEMLGDASGQTHLAAVTVTDANGRFAVLAPPSALISVRPPQGFRAVTPVTQLARARLAFGLQPDRIVVERVQTLAPELKVAVSVPPGQLSLDVTAQLMRVALLLGALSLAAAGLICLGVTLALRAHTRGLLRMRATTVQAQTLLRQGLRLTPERWPTLVAQAVVDAGCAPLVIDRFLGLGLCGQGGWMRFSDAAGRCITLHAGRAGLADLLRVRGRRLDALRHPHSAAQLACVWRYFAQEAGQPHTLAQALCWRVSISPEPQPVWQAQLLRAGAALGHRLRAVADRLQHRSRVVVR